MAVLYSSSDDAFVDVVERKIETHLDFLSIPSQGEKMSKRLGEIISRY